MSLNAGSRLGPHRVTAKIGEGGMGEGVSSARHQARPGWRADGVIPSVHREPGVFREVRPRCLQIIS